MEKKINRKNIKKYAVTGLLVANLVASSGYIGLSIYDSCVDHTQEICPITKMSIAVGDLNSTLFNAGIEHQINQMTEEYSEEESRVNVTFNPKYYDGCDYRVETIKVLPDTKINNETGEIEYDVPEGYSLEYIDGKYYAVKTVVHLIEESCMAFRSEITKDYVAEPMVVDGEFVVPEGYALECIDGKYYVTKTVTSVKTLKLK